ncbi:MAG: hypothetical protein HRT66_13575 [Flavobacteriaceae bacterium]|nr:hypothetical protein [Flavobacteriaceae bacterium]
MKRILLIIGGFILIGVFILGYKIDSDLNELEEAFQTEHNLKDSSFVLLKSQVSPNKKFQFFEYQFDNGGFGYSRVFWSVIKNDSTIFKLEKGLLPDGYKAIEWIDGNELLIEKWEPYYYKNEEVELKSGDFFNGVKLKQVK